MSGADHVEIHEYGFRRDRDADAYCTVEIRAGRMKTKRVIPPAGSEHAFDVPVWDHRIVVSVSPTGRSVQVYVDGEKVL